MGEDSVPEIWSVDRGKLYKPESVVLKQVQHVPPSVSSTEGTDRPVLCL